MKKNYTVSYFLVGIVFFCCISCVFGQNIMDKKYESVVTINGIEVCSNVVKALLDKIIRTEKVAVDIVDRNNGKSLSLDSITETLKPGANVLVNNSENMISVSELFKILKAHAMESPNEIVFRKTLKREKEDIHIQSIKYYDDTFCASDSTSGVFLCVNTNAQISKIDTFRSRNIIPSSIESAIPRYE